MAISLIPGIINSSFERIGNFGGNDAGTYSYTLPPDGFYIVFFKKTNTYDSAQLGAYLVNAVSSNGGRVAIRPLAALPENMSVTIEIVDGKFVLTLDTGASTYMRGYVFKIGG